MNVAPVRFWKKVSITPNGCWEWQGGTSWGYGVIAENSPSLKKVPAHRVSYEFFYGEIPKGLEVCHHCDNKICVNPEHLFLGTHGDNIQDAYDKGFIPRNAGNLSINAGEANGSALLTEEDVLAIRKEAAAGTFHKNLAEHYGVTRECITQIVNRKRWKHV